MHGLSRGYRCFWCGKNPVPGMFKLCADCKAGYDARAADMPAAEHNEAREVAAGMRSVKASDRRRKRGSLRSDCGI